MGKVYDLEEEKQKIKDRLQAEPPILRLRSKDGRFAIYPRMEKGPDGEWRVQNPEAIKKMLGYTDEDTEKEDKPK